MWECDYDRILVSREDMRIFLEKHPVLLRKPLNPRNAFYGDRTESMVSLYDVKGNEKIHYADVCSLYPYICKTGKFPIGHPKVYVGEECREQGLLASKLIKWRVSFIVQFYHRVCFITLYYRYVCMVN